MRFFLYPFILLAGLGLSWSLTSHVCALLGWPIPGGHWAWTLHLGIFVVWLPTVLVGKRMTGNTRRSDFWKIVLAGCPDWARYALYGLFAYTVLNFIIGISARPGQEDSAAGIRIFSGHWMLFYGAAMATLYSAVARPELLLPRTCFLGHRVSLLDENCPVCGTLLTEETTERAPKD